MLNRGTTNVTVFLFTTPHKLLPTRNWPVTLLPWHLSHIWDRALRALEEIPSLWDQFKNFPAIKCWGKDNKKRKAKEWIRAPCHPRGPEKMVIFPCVRPSSPWDHISLPPLPCVLPDAAFGVWVHWGSTGTLEALGEVLAIADWSRDTKWQGTMWIRVQGRLELLWILVSTHCLKGSKIENSVWLKVLMWTRLRAPHASARVRGCWRKLGNVHTWLTTRFSSDCFPFP